MSYPDSKYYRDLANAQYSDALAMMQQQTNYLNSQGINKSDNLEKETKKEIKKVKAKEMKARKILTTLFLAGLYWEIIKFISQSIPLVINHFTK